MQLRLTIQPIHNCVLLQSYRSSVLGLIYHLLKISNPGYAQFLHDKGNQPPNKTRLRLKQFCFSGLHDSHLNHPRRHSLEKGYRLREDHYYSIVFCSPKEEFIKNVLFGIFHEQKTQGHEINIGTCEFEVTGVELVQPPVFNDSQTIRLTPFHSGFIARAKQGILPDGKKFLTLQKKDLLEKQLLDGMLIRIKEHFKKELSKESCQLQFCNIKNEKKHIRRFPVVQNKNLHNLYATYCDIELTGPIELLHMAFLTGIGEKGSLGMGMVRLLS